MAQEKTLTRREKEKQRQRQYILDAALELFSQKGYSNVSMNEIAEKSEFAVGTLYKFFCSKEEIYKSIMLQNSERFHRTLLESLSEGNDEVDTLRKYVRTKRELFFENAAAVQLYHAETIRKGFDAKVGLDDEVRERHDQVQQELTTVFERGMKKGLFNKIAEPSHLAIALDSIHHSFIFLWIEDPDKNEYPDDPDVILNILFKGLLREP